ncbi:DUF3486 family protein [Pseudomonas kunmingensis]|uniref:phage protein Gp27 family protein n=1 Tax=Stutzerimonas kunmingensis TaxID=1211807 RepID=UPI00174755B9|nr:DUF3486 family protein [Stutzerimonas kunmingensis]
MKPEQTCRARGASLAADALPPELKAQLHSRLMTSGFAGYVEHSEWLAGQGWKISKSALHRYGKRNRAAITEEIKQEADAQVIHQEIRLRCLELASKYSSRSELLPNAEELLEWVRDCV